ncbi:MAG: class I SAM-dependent methyltransferase, partial [Spirochaetota bacterium]
KTFATRPRKEPHAALPCPLCGGRAFRPLWDLADFSFVTCRGCGLVQQNPQPLAESVLARYDESYLEYESARQFDYATLERRALADLRFPVIEAEVFREAASLQRKPRILDVGCATGALLATFREAGWDCVGVEPCAPAAEYGRERFKLDIRSSTLEEASLKAASFDVIHASHLIEHVNDPVAFLREVVRLVAEDGYVIITTPNIEGFQARLLGAAWRSAIYDHLYLFSGSTLPAMLSTCGLRVLHSITWGGWAAGLRPSFMKKPLDLAAKRLGFGDVMAFLCRRDRP